MAISKFLDTNFLWEGRVEASISHALHIPRTLLFTFRLLALFTLMGMYASNVYMVKNPFEPLSYFTIWGEFLTLFYFLATVLKHIVSRDTPSTKLDLIGNVLFQIAFTVEFPVTLVYWSVLHWHPTTKQLVSRYEGMPELNVMLHVFPYVSLWIDFMFNSVRCLRNHVFYVIKVSVIYMIVNFIVTMLAHPVYAVILEWNDWVTPVTLVVVTIMICAHHRYVTVAVYEQFKLPRLAKAGLVSQDALLKEYQAV